MEGKQDDPLSVIQQARRFMVVFWEADVETETVTKTSSPTKWQLPNRGWIKMNFDGGIDKEWGGGSVGILARNNEGVCVGWWIKWFSGITNLLHIEAVAARLAVELGLASGWENVVVEGDCHGVIHPLASGLFEPSQIGLVLLEISKMGNSIQRLKWSLVRRIANVPAHCLAQYAKSKSTVSFLPQIVSTAIMADLPYDY
ncbi:hypothetical protein Salat_0907900 [Sesamum alatum]|uniref:RNase H type-1 domain-containing protein n=1 Tax=Sesamum alatum TaxID=300844 RepID=A0AAE1YL00_9LAMI|nr:hypothetical protein Salat_0907900 [Sesamum alatum]